ncbi:hypothetical protein BpHYR1_008309 [Brachionus plicatilis]|uniref:Uncharacterized protein n=1 Tax=Brachionus plicatilis TaxID=10195 RepID=A0A3M7PX38_BRAPC|nr:hypothetical protein BpHYR1_008309 [Brachionus plicatilis]
MTNARINEFLADGKEQRVGCALDVLSPLCRASAKYKLCLKKGIKEKLEGFLENLFFLFPKEPPTDTFFRIIKLNAYKFNGKLLCDLFLSMLLFYSLGDNALLTAPIELDGGMENFY